RHAETIDDIAASAAHVKGRLLLEAGAGRERRAFADLHFVESSAEQGRDREETPEQERRARPKLAAFLLFQRTWRSRATNASAVFSGFGFGAPGSARTETSLGYVMCSLAAAASRRLRLSS